jgi:uncharacterized protein (TIGR03435 family)
VTNHTTKARWTITAALLAATLSAGAQEPPGLTGASFEAATFKQNRSAADGWQFNPRPTGQFTATNARVADLIKAAFLLQPNQLAPLPEWTTSERYDIVARLDPTVASHNQPPDMPPTWALALRDLLAERLKLRFHRELREAPVYALVPARPGQLGPQLKPAAFDCDALRVRALSAARTGGPSPYPATTPDRIACGMRSVPGRITYGGSTLDEFRGALSILTGRAVLDRTGLSGRWDFVLTYATEAQLRSGEPTDAPDLFPALTEQLGLKLQSTTGPVEMFVVDHVERPQTD